MNKSLIVSQLNVQYSNKVILENINFQVSTGQIVGIVGPNGAGKSTLLKSILGLLPQKSGSIKYDNYDLNKQKSKLTYIPQRSQIDWDYPVTVHDVALMGQTFNSKWGDNYPEKSYHLVENALKKLGLYDLRHNRIGELSGGQQQKVFLARALVQEAEIYFLDEPLVGVDYITQGVIFQLLKELSLENKLIIIIHHDLGDVLQYFDELILLNRIIIAQGECKTVLKNRLLSLAYQDN
uniref:manganese transport system ATP-binding protein n=1 Tax=Goniotrichopsis reniformis TaxID=468933 RepID=UPI001FCDAA4C|nr:manganese transport system ATP-binding protein [Goniotrichopsis reniformis]UNJ14755.1 manganese transport system ATP-binding protein [Goniotrichopsis reniformis]